MQMTSLFASRRCWTASVTLAVLLAAAPVLMAQSVPPPQQGTRIDLNSASQAVLETLPGIDQDTAGRIIAGRPYTVVGDLARAGVSPSTIETITPLVKVGPLGTAAAATARGAEKAATGVEKGANATARGVEKGVNAATKGVEKGAAATASAADTVNRKLTGAARVPPQAGMVWADTPTKVYFKDGDPSYGTTKKGKWLTEKEAVKRGYHTVPLLDSTDISR
jgi:hypothetical protein